MPAFLHEEIRHAMNKIIKRAEAPGTDGIITQLAYFKKEKTEWVAIRRP